MQHAGAVFVHCKLDGCSSAVCGILHCSSIVVSHRAVSSNRPLLGM